MARLSDEDTKFFESVLRYTKLQRARMHGDPSPAGRSIARLTTLEGITEVVNEWVHEAGLIFYLVFENDELILKKKSR